MQFDFVNLNFSLFPSLLFLSYIFRTVYKMDVTPVIETLQATLVPHMRKHAEEKLSQVHLFS
jgi:hypothetical protein